jgi:hypothetical protein
MGWRNTFNREPMVGAKIGHSLWNDAYLTAFKLGINFNHFANKDQCQFSLRNVPVVEKEMCFFDKFTFLKTVNVWLGEDILGI